jgi:hypothetical protein
MKDRHLGHVGSWRESEWEATFFKRLRLLGMQNGIAARWDDDRTPIEFLEGVEHYQACMYDAYQTAATAVASDVDYIEATAQAVCDATHNGVLPLDRSLEERRRRALDRAPSVITRAAALAANLESIQRFGDSIFSRGEAMLRARRPFGSGPACNVPEIPIPESLYEIGQARVRAALAVLTSYPLAEWAPRARRPRRSPKDKRSPRVPADLSTAPEARAS